MSEAAAPRPNHLAAVPDTEDERLAALEQLAAAVTHHEQQAEAHTAAAAAAKRAIFKLHGARGSTIHVGNRDLTWKAPARSFQKGEFIKTYPLELNPGFYTLPDPVPVLNMDMVPKALKDQFMKAGDGEGTLVIK